MDDNGLNEHHRRRLAGSAHLIDAAAARLLDLLEGRTSAQLSRPEDTFAPQEREFLLASLARLQQLAEELSRKYGLRHRRRDLRRLVAAELSEVWCILEDTRPKKMRGFGAVPPQAAEELERDLAPLLELTSRMEASLASSSQRAGEGAAAKRRDTL
ncbi:MAG TPA: hypothetical protein VLT85_00055 [Terriglobales bacterium]|nr:hypothetical protein [Terriglobales bacterium]